MTRTLTPLLAALCLLACNRPEAQTTAPAPTEDGAGEAPAPAPVEAAAPSGDVIAADGSTATAEPGGDETPWRSFGAEFESADVVPASQLLDAPEGFAGKTVVLEGTVADVCQKAGCWLVVADGTRSIRIRTRDHGFSVDKDCSGDTARIHGVVISKDITPAEAAHFASESKRPDVAPESGQPEKLYEIEATGIQLKKAS